MKLPVNVTLTIDERDAIDRALHALRGCYALACSLGQMEHRRDLLTSQQLADADGLLLDTMEKAVTGIHDTLNRADTRLPRSRQ
jgi:hypothetical protein